MFKRVWNWITSNETNNLTVITGGAIVFVLNLVISLVLQHYDQVHSEKLAYNQLKQVRSTEIRSAAVDFQTFAAAYVSAVLESESDIPKARERLVESTMQQYATIDLSEALFSNEAQEAAKIYKNALAKFNTTLASANTVTEMRPFWESASDVLVARDNLIRSLDNDVKLNGT